MSEVKSTVYVNLLIAVSVCVWWAANSITAVSSKSFMRGDSKFDKNSWSEAFLDFRWLELTALQHLVGAIASVVWLKIVTRKAVWPVEASKMFILIASLGNVVGNMATNAAYAMVSSSMTQVVKACEPLFMFVLSLILYQDYQVLNSTTLLSIVIMVIGAALFVAFDSTFLVSGLLAALCSNIAFPIRNIYLKKLNSAWENSFQKYAVISSYSVLVCTPFLLVRTLYQSAVFVGRWQEAFISSSFHCTYNLASIYVLQNFTPLTHAILNLLKRGIVITVNLMYFQLPLTWKMVLGLIAVLAGLYIYLQKKMSRDKFNPPSVVLILISVVLGLLFFVPSLGPLNSLKVGTVHRLKLQVDSKAFDDKPLIQSNYDYTYHVPDFSELKTTFGQPPPVENQDVIPPAYTGQIASAWVFDSPMSQQILSNLQRLSKVGPVTLYCGTSRCMQAIKDLSNDRITASFLLIVELVKDTAFEGWLARHMFYKVLAMASYEDHLQEVVRLAILWKYGGLYIEPHVHLKSKQQFPQCSVDPWIGKQEAGGGIQHFDVACFPKQNKFIYKLSMMFAKNYYNPSGKYVPPSMNASESIWNSYFKGEKLPKVVEIDFKTLSLETDQPWNHHYATLSYESRVNVTGVNVGDEIQGFPGLQFLPFIDNFLDRDNLYSNTHNDQHIEAFFNAWWGDYRAKWPPQPNINPIFLSVHINDEMESIWEREVEYLMPRAPIGCRDFNTVDFLTKHGVPAYFSGCMTLTLQWRFDRPRTDEIWMVDVKQNFYKFLPGRIRAKVINVAHSLSVTRFRQVEEVVRFNEAFKFIDRYSRAKLVITQRIHCALPCVAMGTPVIFIQSKHLPGDKNLSTSRTAGLTSMFHTLDTQKEDPTEWFANFPWDNPTPNPDMATHMRLRAAFWYEIRKRPSLFDAGRKFGVVPMSPPTPCTDILQFHVHFPHPDDHFTWQDHRSVESILRHHPCASVLIHSNTLNDERFDVFRESGYVIKTQAYDLNELLSETTFELPEISEEDNHLFPALFLYKWGGVYMTSNIILTRSLEDLPKEFVVWADSTEERVDPSFMRFEKGHKFLESVIAKLATDPDNNDDSVYTQALEEDGDDVETLNSNSVFVFDKTQVNKQCYEETSGPEYDSWRKTIAESAVAVALSLDYSLTKSIGTTPLKAGTLCQMLLHDFCVICSELL